MIARLYSAIVCECGYGLMHKTVGQVRWMECPNDKCPFYGRKFRLPEIEVEEL